MMSLFGANAANAVVPAVGGTGPMVSLAMVKSVIEEVANERSANLAFRQAISDHEKANTAASVPKAADTAATKPQVRQLTGRSGGSGGGAMSMAPTNKRDLRVKPPDNKNVPMSVPRQVSNQVVWDVVKVDGTISFNSPTPGEVNFAPSLQDHPQSGSWRALFDQWCIPQFSVTFNSDTMPGGLSPMPRFYTALDFDNSGPIGGVGNIEDFSTCVSTVMTPQTKLVRSVHPTVKTASGGAASALITRQWVDSGAPGTMWYGIRSYATVDSANTSQIYYTQTIWYAFRNQI